MAKTAFVDFRAVKAAITMEQLLGHYKILDQFKRTGDSLNGPCPIHKGSNPTQFRVSTTKNIWNCFSDCEHGGNTLDFITLGRACRVKVTLPKAFSVSNRPHVHAKICRSTALWETRIFQDDLVSDEPCDLVLVIPQNALFVSLSRFGREPGDRRPESPVLEYYLNELGIHFLLANQGST